MTKFFSDNAMEHQVNTQELLIPSDISDDDAFILSRVKDYTMTSMERQLALIQAIRHIVRSNLPGCFVECGVWKGGSAMVAALTFMQEKDTSRHLYLYDTFEGMTEPTEQDKTYDGVFARDHLEKMEKGTEWWCYSPFDEVKANIESTGFPVDQIHLVKGPVELTLPDQSPQEAIALLRLDTDWYESTKHELIHLFPLLRTEGVLIIDDYGHWRGSKQAVDEYFAGLARKHYMHRIDYTGRLLIKAGGSLSEQFHQENGSGLSLVQDNQRRLLDQSRNIDDQQVSSPDAYSYVSVGSQECPLQFPEDDYVSPGLQQIRPDRCFPNMLFGNPQTDCIWPFLRRGIPHNWYVDQRYPNVGFINRDEAHILYNSALLFQGKRALEVGCWMGWSACHIALAGLEVDVIDPILEKPEVFESVRDSLKRAGVLGSVRLIPGSSPEKVEEIARQEQRRWSFMFIDGNHESPYPLNDAVAAEPFAEEDALVLFHDLISPGVSEALEYMRKKGWNVMIYHTMQIMGAAWRGNVKPVMHQPDPQVYWQVPEHLRSFCGNLGRQPSDSDPALTATLSGQQAELDWLRLQLKSSQDQFWQIKGERDWFETTLQARSEELSQAKLEQAQNQTELNMVQVQVEQANVQLEQVNVQLEQVTTQRSSLESKLHQARGVISYLQRQLQQAEVLQQRLTQTEQAVLQNARTRIQNLEAELEKKRGRLQLRKENLELKKAELAEARGQIAAMESSKFWKIRKIWFNVKRLFGVENQD